ncbi:Outer membrane protein TolC [Chitinophaga sp. CF118]|uniref:TolC family protein n=1 Tax=Chitinophaga sp. CF118 TaxID=1884367 RepID=UPI0008F262BA|nr:TolC family protein [Chitinophaga sp. CF118]SFE16417.1 Outer membrane protein TolC [Chitinophaga sp. CF118]
MKKILFILFITLPFLSYAQLPISLQQAMDMSLKNRYDIHANQYNILISGNEISKNKKEWLPDINGSGDIRYNIQFQATYIPAGFGGSDKPSLLALAPKNVTVFGLDLHQNIYNPGISNDIKIAKNNLALQQEKNRADEITIKTQVSEAYLNVLLKQLQYKIATDDENRYKEYFQLAEGKYNQGALIENDFLHAKLDYENARLQSTTAKQNNDLAIDNLKYQLNVPVNTILLLTDSLNSQNVLNNPAPGERTEIRQLMLEQQNNTLQLQKIRQSVLPTLAFTANYSQQFLYDNFNYTKSEWWAPFSYVGLKLNVPISAHFKNKSTIREYQYRISRTDWELKQKTADVENDIRTAQTSLNNALQNVETTKRNYELSNIIYRNQQQQFTAGSFEYSNLLDTEKSLATAEQNYIRAVYDCLLAKINLQKAQGNL